MNLNSPSMTLLDRHGIFAAGCCVAGAVNTLIVGMVSVVVVGSFQPWGTAAAILMIVGLGLLLGVRWLRKSRARARTRDAQWSKEEIERLTRSPTGADAMAYGFNRIDTPEQVRAMEGTINRVVERSREEMRNSHAPEQRGRKVDFILMDDLPEPPQVTIPNFVGDLPDQIRGAGIRSLVTTPGGRLVRVERFAEPVTVTEDGWPPGEATHKQAVEDAKNREVTAAMMSIDMTKPRNERASAVREAYQTNRDAHWAGRARDLMDSGNVSDDFRELLESAATPTSEIKRRARALVESMQAGPDAAPRLGYDQGPVPAEFVITVMQAQKEHALQKAQAMEKIIDQLADDVSRLRGRVVGQVGNAAAAQAAAAERAINLTGEDPDAKAERDLAETLSDEALLREVEARGIQ